MSLQLLVDGGQSTCRVALVDGEAACKEWERPGLSYGADAEGVSTVLELVAAIADEAQASLRDLGGVWLGLSGMPRLAQRRAAIAAGVRERLGDVNVVLMADLVSAYVGALGLRPGAVLSAGSGAVALAVAPDGSMAEVGNHGALFGDQGSAYWIGHKGLRAVVRADDGWGERTTLVAAAEERYGSIAGLPGLFRAESNPVDAMARFAIDVLRDADAGDPVAVRIVSSAARLLAGMLSAAASQAHPRSDARIATSWSGRLLTGGVLLEREVRRWLAARLGDRLEVVEPAGRPLDGLKTMARSPSLDLVDHALYRRNRP